MALTRRARSIMRSWPAKTTATTIAKSSGGFVVGRGTVYRKLIAATTRVKRATSVEAEIAVCLKGPPTAVMAPLARLGPNVPVISRVAWLSMRSIAKAIAAAVE